MLSPSQHIQKKLKTHHHSHHNNQMQVEGSLDGKILNRFSRQNAALGADTTAKLIKMKILVFGLRGVGVETCKNLSLQGAGSITVSESIEKSIESNDVVLVGGSCSCRTQRRRRELLLNRERHRTTSCYYCSTEIEGAESYLCSECRRVIRSVDRRSAQRCRHHTIREYRRTLSTE